MVIAATAGAMVAQADDVAPRPGWRMTAGPPEPVHPREWTPIVDEMEIRRGGLDATVQIGASHVAILRKQFGRQCEVLA